MINRTRLIVGLVIAVGTAVVGWFFLGDDIRERSNRRQFDPVAWKANSHNFTNAVRIRMVDDLLRREKFRGMTRSQLTAIIGEPDDTPYFKNWDMVYWLGPERGFISIDSEWLVFRLDSQKTVTDFRIVSD
jgi:hypothetical protein